MIKYIICFLFIIAIVYQQKIKQVCFNIAHGCGSIDMITITNSLEAFNKSYSLGYRVIEIDLLVTNDNHIVGAHDWKKFKKIVYYNSNKTIPSLIDIKKSKIFKKYNLIYDTMIYDLLAKYKDVVIFTDKITNYLLLKRYIGCSNRLHIEVFNIQQYNLAKSMGYRNIMLSIKSENDLNKLISNNNSISAITVDEKIYYSYKPILYMLFKKKIRIFAYSIHDINEINKSFCKIVSGFYIDLTEKFF